MKKQKSLTLSGFKMVYFTNESKAPAIIFIHGNNLSKDVFNYQFEDPSLNRFNLIAIDLPGHGNSAVVNGDKKSFYTVPGMAGCINDLVVPLRR
jgi:pimeloyl-ACP methyl ester carboxylesterase